MNALASRLASTANSSIRLKVIDTGTPLGAAEAFSKGDVDLAIVRGDATDLKGARTVVVITHGVLMLLGLPGTSITDFDHLKGKTIGVVGGAVNQRIASVLDSEYDLTRSKVKFRGPHAAGSCGGHTGQEGPGAPVRHADLRPLSDHPAQFLPARRSRKAPTLLAIEFCGRHCRCGRSLRKLRYPEGHDPRVACDPGRRPDHIARADLSDREGEAERRHRDPAHPGDHGNPRQHDRRASDPRADHRAIDREGCADSVSIPAPRPFSAAT